jgi:signal transduction histidine kinase
MTTSRVRSVRVHLIRLVIASVVPVLAFAIVMVALFGSQQRALVEQRVRETARALAASVDQELRSSIATLEALATSRHLDTGDFGAFDEEARRVLPARPAWLTINLFDGSARQLVNLFRPYGTPLPDPADRPSILRVLETGQASVSDMFVGAVLGRPLVRIIVPVRRDGKVVYALAAGLDIATLQRRIAPDTLPGEWIATLTDRSGTMIARSQHFDVDGVSVYAAHSPTGLAQWTVGLAVPTATVNAPRTVSLWIVTGGGALLLLLGALLATRVGTRIAADINALPAAATGEAAAPAPPSRIAEIRAVEREIAAAREGRAAAEQALAKSTERLNVLHEIDRAVIQAEAPVAMAEAVLRRIRDLLGVPRAIVNLFNLETGEAEWLGAIGRRRIHLGPGVRFPIELMGDIAGLRRNEVQVIDVDALPRGPEVDALLASDVHVYMVVPLIAGGELIGGLSFGGPSGDFPPEQISIAREVAAQFAIAISQARLHERVKEQAANLEVRVAERTRELALANQQLQQEIGERRRAEENAEIANRAKSEFLSRMSHELRTPLNAILGFGQLLHDERIGPLSVEQKEYLGDIVTSGRHLLSLVNDVLDLAKIEAGKLEFHAVPLDPAGIVAEVSDMARSLAAQKRITLSSEIDPALTEIIVDPMRLKQVLMNYVSNAVKFTPDGGHVTIRLSVETADAFRVAVEDTGIGIAEEDIGRLFVEFAQLDAAVALKVAGTGLGLALTRRIVESQGGRVGVDSKVGQGSVFYAVLPRIATV